MSGFPGENVVGVLVLPSGEPVQFGIGVTTDMQGNNATGSGNIGTAFNHDPRFPTNWHHFQLTKVTSNVWEKTKGGVLVKGIGNWMVNAEMEAEFIDGTDKASFLIKRPNLIMPDGTLVIGETLLECPDLTLIQPGGRITIGFP
jgi:hypothetical protein